MDNRDFEREAARLQSLLKLDLLETPIDNRYERITRLLQKLLNVPITAFNLVDDHRQWAKAAQGMSVIEVARNASFCATMLEGNEEMVINDARKDDRFVNNPLVTSAPNIVFYAGYPVHAPDGEKIGSLCAADSKPRYMSGRDMQTLKDLAGLLETELKLETLEKQMGSMKQKIEATERVALIDPLTRLWNKAGIQRVLHSEWQNRKNSHEPLSLIIADIDRFKNFNAEHGRVTGDVVLQRLGKILLSLQRAEDTVSRYGEDQFMIVLPGCDERDLQTVLARLKMETLIADLDDSGPLPVTVSFGASYCNEREAFDFTDLIRNADEALVEVKKAGGNKTSVRGVSKTTAAA